MTERLYYNDSFLLEFEAQVNSCQPALQPDGAQSKRAAEWRVTLDRSAFYPASGGQLCDTGQLGTAKVVDVYERDGLITHVTDRPVEVGTIRGAIERSQRFDHMQQHTGQHLLSAVFIRLFGFQTVSFHMGKESSTIDLTTASLFT